MNILFFTHYFPPEGNAPASRTYEHCKRWVAEGHQVTVVTSVPNAPDGVVYKGWKNRWWPQREELDGIHVLRIWTYLAANAGTLRRILNYLSYMFSAIPVTIFFCRRPHVIVATSPQFFCGWAGVFASWLKWSPLVLEIRDIWPDSIVTVGAMKPGWTIRFLGFLERLMYRSARTIIAVTNGIRDDIQRKVPKHTKIKVITNGVDLGRFPQLPPNPEFRSTWQVENKFVCGYIGTVGMAHGLRVVLDAARLLREAGQHEVAFLIVGDGAERADLEKECITSGLEQWVKFAGRIPKEDVPTALASVDVLLVHLKKNRLFEAAIPSKIFEAMAMDKPLLVGVQGEVEDIIKRSQCGILFEPENAEALVKILKELADNPDLLIMMKNKGREFVAQFYSRDSLAHEMLQWILNSTSRV